MKFKFDNKQCGYKKKIEIENTIWEVKLCKNLKCPFINSCEVNVKNNIHKILSNNENILISVLEELLNDLLKDFVPYFKINDKHLLLSYIKNNKEEDFLEYFKKINKNSYILYKKRIKYIFIKLQNYIK